MLWLKDFWTATLQRRNSESRGKEGEPAGILQALLLDINIRNLLFFEWRRGLLTTTGYILQLFHWKNFCVLVFIILFHNLKFLIVKHIVAQTLSCWALLDTSFVRNSSNYIRLFTRLIEVFWLTMQRYIDFGKIPRKFPIFSLTCSDNYPLEATNRANALKICRVKGQEKVDNIWRFQI